MTVQDLGSKLEDVELTNGAKFDSGSHLGRQLGEVAKVMKLDAGRGMERAAFFTQQWGK